MPSAATAPPTPREPGTTPPLAYVPGLDGLRAIAVLLVLFTHFWQYPRGWTVINRLAETGWVGVDLFFVLSGFLITRILVHTKNHPAYFRTFYARRTLRIFPLYFLVLAIVFLVVPRIGWLPPRVVEDRWLYALYLSNVALAASGWQIQKLDITWSLAIEEQFYLVWPSVVRLLTTERLASLCLGLVVGTPLARLLFFNQLGWRWVQMLTPFRADAFAAGALIVLLPVSRRLAAAGLVAGGTLLVALATTGEFGRESWFVGTFGFSLTATTAAAAVALAPRASWLEARPLRHIGAVSYGVYLWHPLALTAASYAFAAAGVDVMHLTGRADVDALTFLPVITAISVGVATLSFRYFERPFLALKDRLAPGH